MKCMKVCVSPNLWNSRDFSFHDLHGKCFSSVRSVFSVVALDFQIPATRYFPVPQLNRRLQHAVRQIPAPVRYNAAKSPPGVMAMHSKLKNNGIFLIVALIATLALPATATAAIYKWVDENGQTVYSETPPPAGVERMHIKGAPPPPVDPEQAMQELRDRAKALDQRRDERTGNETEAQQNAERQKRTQENCEILRKNLSVLNSGRRIRETGSDGEQAFLDETQLAARLKETQDRINKECQ